MAPYRAVKTMASAPVWNAAGHRLTRCEEQAEKHRHFTCWSATADEWFRAQCAKSSHWLMQFDKRGWLESHCKWRFIAGKITYIYIYICKSGILHFGCWGVAGCTYPGSWIQHPTRFSSCLRLQKKDKTGQLKWQNMICVRPRQVRKHAICLPHQIHRERQWLARYVGIDWPTRSFILFKINNINSYVLSIFYAHIYIYTSGGYPSRNTTTKVRWNWKTCRHGSGRTARLAKAEVSRVGLFKIPIYQHFYINIYIYMDEL